MPLREGRNAFEAHPPVKAGAFVDAGAGESVVWFVPGMPMVTTQRVGHEGHEVHDGTRVVAVGFEFANGVDWATPGGVAPARSWTRPSRSTSWCRWWTQG